MTVAPSLVMVVLPFSSTSSRSPPYGPRVLLMVDWTAKQALMFDMICPRPCDWSVPARYWLATPNLSISDCFFSPSFRTMIVGVCPPKDMLGVVF